MAYGAATPFGGIGNAQFAWPMTPLPARRFRRAAISLDPLWNNHPVLPGNVPRNRANGASRAGIRATTLAEDRHWARAMRSGDCRR
jgi:hypothetical protein